mgnify:CR=1 FL=1
MSTMYVNNIAPLEGNTINVASGSTLYAPGSVLQVLQGTGGGTGISNSTTNYSDINLSVTITPNSVNSKILVTCSFTGYSYTEPGQDAQAIFRIMRGSSTQLIETRCGDHNGNGNRSDDISPINMTYLDSPATTSPTTYKVQYKVNGAGREAIAYTGSTIGTIVVMEIAG